MAAATTGRATLSDGVDMAVSPACPELCAYARSLDVDNVDAGRIAEQFGLISEPIDLNIGTEASDDLCIACNEGRDACGEGEFARVFTCGICLEPCWLDEHSSLAPACCNHRFCNRCWAAWVRASLDAGTDSLRSFRCPTLGCANSALTVPAKARAMLALRDGLGMLCKGVLDREDKRAIRDLLALDGNPDARRCPTCKHVTATRVASSTGPSLQCQNEACALVFCRFHGDAHPGETCNAFLRRLPVDRAHAAKHTRRCPQCGRSILKDGGCDHSAYS